MMKMDLLLKLVCKTWLASFFKWQGENDNKKGWKIYRNYHPDKSRDMTRIIFIVFAPAHDLNNWTLLCWDESIWPEHQARTVMSSQWIRHCSTSWCSSNWQMLWASLVLEHMMNKAPSDSKTPEGRIKCDTQHETESTLLAVYLRFGVSKLMTTDTTDYCKLGIGHAGKRNWSVDSWGKSIRSSGYVCGQEVVASRREKSAIFRAELPQNKYLTYASLISKCSCPTQG